MSTIRESDNALMPTAAREGLRSFLNGGIIGLAVVGPLALLDATDHGFLGTLVLWGALGLAAAALNRWRRAASGSRTTERNSDDE